jgi:hypothetical protein
MLMNVLLRLVLAIALVPFLGACDREDLTQPPDIEGRLDFSYSGTREGSFSAQGALRPGQPHSFATGFVIELPAAGIRALRVVAIDLRTTFTGHGLALTTSHIEPGTYPLVPACDLTTGQRCADGLVHFNLDTRDEAVGEIYELVSGSVTITTIAGSRVHGTFSGVARHPEIPDRTITLGSGSFEVPLRALANPAFELGLPRPLLPLGY